MTGGPHFSTSSLMYRGILSTLNNKTKEFFVGLVIASFNNHLSHFSDLERSIVGQPVIPSPTKNMPPKSDPKKKVTHPKITPAPRDRTGQGLVSYPQTKEGGLNKYAKSIKNKRLDEAVDNLDIAAKAKHATESKSTMEVMGVKLEATMIIWILINEDTDEVLAKLIATGLDNHKSSGSTIQVLCTEAAKNVKETFEEEKINDFLDKILDSFVDNHNDLGELLVDQTGDFMSDKIKQLLGNVEEVLEGAFLDILKLLADNSDDEIIDIPSVPSGDNLKDITRVTDYINGLIIDLTVKKLELPSRTPRDRDSNVVLLCF